MTKTHLTILLGFLVVWTGSSLFAGDTPTVPGKQRCVAHRGFSYDYPENTMIAFEQAIRVGAHYTETDIYRTADGVLVLLHDANLKRTAGQDIDVRKANYADIRDIDVGSWKGEKFAGEKIPTLDECLRLFKGTSSCPALEIKMGGIEQDVIDALRKHEMIDKVTVLDFNDKHLAKLRELEPRLETVWNFSKNVGNPEEHVDALFEELDRRATACKTKILSLHLNVLSKELIRRLHEKGYVIWGWPANDVPTMEKLLDWGSDVITTDRPDMLLEVLEKRAKKNP